MNDKLSKKDIIVITVSTLVLLALFISFIVLIKTNDVIGEAFANFFNTKNSGGSYGVVFMYVFIFGFIIIGIMGKKK